MADLSVYDDPRLPSIEEGLNAMGLNVNIVSHFTRHERLMRDGGQMRRTQRIRPMRYRYLTLAVGLLLTPALASTAPLISTAPLSAAGLEPLVSLSISRLQIARQVALSKWDSQKPVQDTLREEQVIAGAVASAQKAGLSPGLAKRFFADQIEANKLVQYRLLAQWQRDGRAPDEARVNLGETIRPALDRLQEQLIHALVASRPWLAKREACQRARVLAVQAELSGRTPEELDAIALDRALGSLCE